VSEEFAQHPERGLAQAVQDHRSRLFHRHGSLHPAVTFDEIEATRLTPVAWVPPYRAVLDMVFGSTAFA